MAFFDYRIAAAWNVALVSLTNIERITPSGGKRFYAPKGYGLQNPGNRRIRLDGLDFIEGKASAVWRFDAMSWFQYEYLKYTYCNGGLDGKVTIYHRTRVNPDTYTRYNAILKLPKLVDIDAEFFGIRRIDVLMLGLRTPS